MSDSESPPPDKATSKVPASTLSTLPFGFNHPSHWSPQHTRSVPGFSQPTAVEFTDKKTGVDLVWNARDHRKGKYPRKKRKSPVPRPWSIKTAFPRLWGWDFGDISWSTALIFLWPICSLLMRCFQRSRWVGQLFLVGSVFWCMCALLHPLFFCMTPHAHLLS